MYTRVKENVSRDIHYFLFNVKKQELRPDAEVSACEWILIDKAEDKLTYKEDKEFFKRIKHELHFWAEKVHHSIPQKFIEVLKIINRKFKNQKIKWVLTGSTNLALQGVRIKPKDVDILTDKKGAFKINKVLQEYEVKPVKFNCSKIFESYLGQFKINSLKVEVMGNLKEKLNNKWIFVSKRLVSPKTIEIKKMRIPLSDLEELLKAYEKLGRKKDSIRAQRIKEALERRAKTD